LKDILIGLLLGYLYVEKQKGYKNARVQFKQSTAHKEYLEHLYDLFKEYCGSKPKITSWFDSRPDRNKEYSSMKFGTYILPCFNEFYDLFYHEGTKCIPSNIGDLLTPLSLAFCIADDGTFDKSNQTVILCTDSFTLEEVELLINVLNDKWNLECYKKLQLVIIELLYHEDHYLFYNPY
jgi:LAGLIDADG DNA endonuclease family